MSKHSNKKKILLIASNSIDTQPLNLPKEFRDIEEAIEIAEQGREFYIYKTDATRYKDLRRKLLKYQPNIIHFSAHGSTNGLFLEDNDGRAKKVSTERLVALLSKFNEHLECVIFNACDSEPIAKAVSQYIPYSIGMSTAISDPAAIEFSIGFYDALGNKRSYNDAFDFGINAISDVKNTSSRSFELVSDSTTTESKIVIPVLFRNAKITNENKQRNKKQSAKTSKKTSIPVVTSSNNPPFYKSFKAQSIVATLIALVIYGVQFYSDMKPDPMEEKITNTPRSFFSTFSSSSLKDCRITGNAESIVQAAGRGHITRVKTCLDLNVYVDTKDANEWTPLHAASFEGHLDTVRLLVSKGASIDEPANLSRTPLYLAVLGNHYQVVHYLLSNGANRNKADEEGILPIARAKTGQMRNLFSQSR